MSGIFGTVDGVARAQIVALEGNIAGGAFQRLPNVGGTAAAITTDAPEGFTGYQDGATYAFRAASSVYSAVSINIGGFGARGIYSAGANNAAFFGGDVIYLTYHAAGGYFMYAARPLSGSLTNKLSGAPVLGVGLPLARHDHNHGSAIVGVTDGSSALAGDVGEYITSIVPLASAVALVSGVRANMTSIVITPGDWDITEGMIFNGDAAASITAYEGSISLTSAVHAHEHGDCLYSGTPIALGAINKFPCSPSTRRETVAVNTTIYAVASASFGAGAVSAFGELSARRVR